MALHGAMDLDDASIQRVIPPLGNHQTRAFTLALGRIRLHLMWRAIQAGFISFRRKSQCSVFQALSNVPMG